MAELLSISIPTRNRFNYLIELLASINNQYEKGLFDKIKVYIFDNFSSDNTQYINENDYNFKYEYYRQDHRLLGDQSISWAYTHTNGDYMWICGDDELSNPNSIATIISKLQKYKPGLLLLNDGSYRTLLPDPTREYYQNYREFAELCDKYNSHLLIAHSLISCNVVRKDCYNEDVLKTIQKDNTCYNHFQSIIGTLTYNDPVVLCSQKTLIVRDQRASPVENEWHPDLNSVQIEYLRWVKERYNLKFNPDSVFSDYNSKL